MAAKWFLPEEQEDLARRILVQAEVLLAPDFLRVELANVLWKSTVRGGLDSDQALRIMEGLDDHPVALQATEPLVPRALRLAVELAHPVYDCVYLALAEREDCRVVTADRRLHQRVQSSDLAGRTVQLEHAAAEFPDPDEGEG